MALARYRGEAMSQESATEFHVEVVKLGKILDLENSTSLSITNVLDGFPCIIKRGSFKEGDLAIYIPIDSIVDTKMPEFQFLNKGKRYRRIKALKLRGTFSMGLLIPAPDGAVVAQRERDAALAACANMRAVLEENGGWCSDDAGKGWASPEVVAQAVEAIDDALDWVRSSDAQSYVTHQLIDALAALKGAQK
jgi:hypothetical protein